MAYENRLIKRLKELKSELETLRTQYKRIDHLPMSDLSKEATKRAIEMRVNSIEQELQEIQKKLDTLFYRTHLYLGELGRKVAELARKQGVSRSEIVRRALEEYLERYGW